MNGYNSNYEADKNQVNRSLELAANRLYNKATQRGLLAGLKRLFGRGEVPSLFGGRNEDRPGHDFRHSS
jgi:hypothetical protein